MEMRKSIEAALQAKLTQTHNPMNPTAYLTWLASECTMTIQALDQAQESEKMPLSVCENNKIRLSACKDGLYEIINSGG